jgi:hypothetical protein
MQSVRLLVSGLIADSWVRSQPLQVRSVTEKLTMVSGFLRVLSFPHSRNYFANASYSFSYQQENQAKPGYIKK